MNKTILPILFLFLIYCNITDAQVTIGSAIPPKQGAILDLKEDGITKKGLGLPRVNLKFLTIPDSETSLSTTIDGATGIWDKEEHIGLVVYHAGDYDACDSRSIGHGLYVWGGDKWQYLGKKDKLGAGVEILHDSRDNESYYFRSFGDAGYWMLENIRYIDPMMTLGIGGENINDKYYVYPNASFTDPTAIPNTWRPEQGLLYSYSAATLGAQDHIEDSEAQGQDEEYEANSEGIQGICPEGWHIPTDREWNLLEKELYNNPEKYSTYNSSTVFDPEEWQSTWETTESVRGANPVQVGENFVPADGHGKAMLSSCLPVKEAGVTPTGIVGGKSLSAKDGGFDILFLGASNVEEGALGYGSIAGFWTSSLAESSYSAWSRFFYGELGVPSTGLYQSQQVHRDMDYRQSLFSIRCKRN